MNDYMTPEKLLMLLPDNQFYIRATFDKIREYSSSQRFPKPKYALWEMLSAWYILISTKKVSTEDGIVAIKCK